MAKLTLNSIGSRYGSIDSLNDNFDAIEQALENTLSRDGTSPNAMEADLDLNDNDLLNVGVTNTQTLYINGIEVEPNTGVTAGSAFQTYSFTATAAQTTFSVAPYTPLVSSIVVIVNGLELPPADVSVSTINVVIPACTAGDEVVIRRFTKEPTVYPTAATQDFQQAGAGAQVRTVQSKLREIEISLTDYGADPTGAVSCNDALAAAKTHFDTFTVTPDAGGPRVRAKFVVPPGTFLLTADAELPIYTECQGRFTGSYKLKLTNVKRPIIKGLSCTTLKISGAWFGIFEDIFGDIEIDGGGVGFGTFWNTFIRCQANVSISLSNWSVNQNTFSGRGGFVTTGSGANVLDGHANNTVDWDFTGGQCSNTASVLQDSLLIGTYYEAGADVVGPYHMFGFQGDSGGPPRVTRTNHILGSYNVIEKNRADFLATGGNILAGGSWDALDSAGKPPCIAANNIGNTVTADTTEPFGMGVKFGGAATLAFSNFTITIPPCPTGQFSLVVSYQGDDFAAVEVQRGGGGGTSSGGASVVTVDSVNNWKLLRLSGKASTTSSTSVVLFALTSAGSKTIRIGGMYATWEKAAQFPAPQYIREAHGTVTQGYVSGASSVAVSVTFPKAFASAPTIIVSIGDNGAQTPNYTKVIVESPSVSGFTARVYYSTDWTGKINWFARGVN